MAGNIFSILNISITNELKNAPSGVWFVYNPTEFTDCPYGSGITHSSVLISINNIGYKTQVLIDVESVSTNNQGIWISYQSQIWRKIL